MQNTTKLKKGKGSFDHNVGVLSGEVVSPGRHKAILTIAKKYGISYEDAQQRQAQKIAQARELKK